MSPRLFLALAVLVLTSGCVRLTLAWADLTPDRPPAAPPVLGSLDGATRIETAEDWRGEVTLIRAALERHVYGAMPDNGAVRVIDKRVVDDAYLGGRARLEDWSIGVSAGFNGTRSPEQVYHLALMLPADRSGPVPVILMETFCRNHNTFPGTDVWRPDGETMCDGDGMMSSAMSYVFGRYITTPPLEQVAGAGYAIAAFHPGDVVPDEAGAGNRALRTLSAGHDEDETRWGAVAAWGWLFSQSAAALRADDRLAESPMIAWGHSRYGKAALVAAAYDESLDGVIAHQSGAGGASLNRNKKGESVAMITDSYPHWFADSYAAWGGRTGEMPVDQHHLLALIAPRPVFLGNARRDVWSDPAGSFIAAEGADPAYELLGSDGLEQDTLRAFEPQADLSFFIRPGTHGITEEDWPAFLAFLDAHFPAGDEG